MNALNERRPRYKTKDMNRRWTRPETTTLGLEVKDISSSRKVLEGLDAKVKQLRGNLNQKLGVLKKDLKIELDAPNEIEVEYDHENEKIIVCRPTGETFSVEKLSRGARDQLYLSIRVALGQMLLEGKSGFFIMDDAFISSDDKRIKQQIDLLKNISEMGWQSILVQRRKQSNSCLIQQRTKQLP